jgi:hypothetical protein
MPKGNKKQKTSTDNLYEQNVAEQREQYVENYKNTQEPYVVKGANKNVTKKVIGDRYSDLEALAVLPYDRTPIKLEATPPKELTADKRKEDVLPELQEFLDAKQELKDWEETRKEILDAGIKEQTIPDYAKVAKDLQDEDEGRPPGLIPSALPGANLSRPSDRVSFLFLFLFRRPNLV